MLRPTKVRQHLAFMQARGFSPRQVLERTGIDALRLNDATYLVSAEQSYTVVSNMMRLTGDAGIGLKAGADTRIADLGIVGYAIASSSTVEQAIGIWVTYGNSPVGVPFSLAAIPADDACAWGATAIPSGIGGSIFRFYVEETFAMGIALVRILTGDAPRVKRVTCAFPAPPHWREYKALFRCPLDFDADRTSITMASPPLDTPLRGSDHELREMCIRQCSLLVRQVDRGGPVSARLRMYFRTEGRVTDLDGAAEALAMSARSLRRHLRAEDTTFQRVLDEFRKDLADEYLRSGALANKKIASLLGFSNVDSFRRAYRAWGGTWRQAEDVTPGDAHATPRRTSASTALRSR